MNCTRRSFLKMLGVGAAVASTGPTFNAFQFAPFDDKAYKLCETFDWDAGYYWMVYRADVMGANGAQYTYNARIDDGVDLTPELVRARAMGEVALLRLAARDGTILVGEIPMPPGARSVEEYLAAA